MKITLTLFLTFALCGIASSKCSFNPNFHGNYFRLYMGHFIYDSVQNIYYKRPGDTVAAERYLGSISGPEGECYTLEYYYNGVDVTNDSNLDFKNIYRPGIYVCVQSPTYGGCCAAGVSLTVRDSMFSSTSIITLSSQAEDYMVSNPFTDEISLMFYSSSEKSVLYSISQISGQIQSAGREKITEGRNYIKIQTADWSKGIYILSISAENVMDITKRILVVKL